MRAFSWQPGCAPATRSLPSSTAPSTTTSRAPGRNTRIHSSIAASGCGRVHSTCRLIARSKLAGANGNLLGVALLEADREAALGCLALGPRDHRWGEIDAGHAMPARGELEAEKPGAAAEIERVERAVRRQHQAENAVPRGALGRGADAVAEILVEMRRPPVPMGGDLLFDRVGMQ